MPMKPYVLLFFLTVILVFPAYPVKPANEKKLLLGVMLFPPYILVENGSYSGVCIDLWRMISDSLNQDYSFKFYNTFDSLQQDLYKGKIDLSLCPSTVTNERLQKFGISIPFYISNMGIATRVEETAPFIQVMKNLLSWKILRWLFLILMIASIFATVLWIAERRKNPVQFRPGFRGVADGIWWAFVTMTTVGYGDKIPKTPIGRILAILWMFFAIGLFFISTGVVSSELTVKTLQSQIKTPDDLSKYKVGTMAESGYAETLNRNNLQFQVFSDLPEGLKSLNSGKIDAFVYDQTLLTYVIKKIKLEEDILVYPSTLNLQYFCFLASPKDPWLIDKINPVLLKAIDGTAWEQILSRYNIH